MLFGVDAGGTTTTILTEHPGGDRYRTQLASVNPAAVGAEAAYTTLAALFAWLVARAGDIPVTGCFASASATADTLATVGGAIRSAAADAGLEGSALLVEDVTPLLLAPPLLGVGVACVIGTGAITIARGPGGGLVQCGGYEYLVADEGAGFDLGMQGLRAAARAYDGRGPATMLLDHARTSYGADLPVLGVELAEAPFPKAAVARFARWVCQAAESGDRVAAWLVDEAVRAAMCGLATAWEAVGRSVTEVVLAGGLAANNPYFSGALMGALRQMEPGLRVHIQHDPAGSALELARLSHRGETPPAIADVAHLRVELGSWREVRAGAEPGMHVDVLPPFDEQQATA